MDTKVTPEQPEMIPVESSNIAAIGRTTNHILFRSGALYFYPGAPAEVFEAFRQAESKGKFFGAFIRTHYQGNNMGAYNPRQESLRERAERELKEVRG